MGRNRALGTPFEVGTVAASFTTEPHVDSYGIDASIGSPVTVQLDPNAFNGDQVIVQDVAGNAGTQAITIHAATGQTILNFGATMSVATNWAGVLLTFSVQLAGWIPQLLAGASAGGGGEITEIVFRPGVASASPVFETWAESLAAVHASPVPVTVFVDSSIAAAVVPALSGVSNLLETTTLAGFRSTSTDVLGVEDGATLTDLLRVTNGLSIQINSTATPGLRWSNDATFYVDNAFFSNAGTGAAAAVDGILGVTMTNGAVLDSNSGGPFFKLSAPGVLFVAMATSSELNDLILDATSSAASTTEVDFDASSFVLDTASFAGYAGTLTLSRITDGARVNPSVGGTSGRPTGIDVVPGQTYYDTDIGALITWDGAEWVAGVFASQSATVTPGIGLSNAFTTVASVTFTSSGGEFAFVAADVGLIGGSETNTGFQLEATCTGQTPQTTQTDGPFGTAVGTTLPIICQFGPLAAGGVTITVRAKTTVGGGIGQTGTGALVMQRSLNSGE